MPGNTPSAGYFGLHNRTDQSVDLVGVDTTAFGSAMLHQTQTDNDVKKMVMLDKVSVPGRSTLSFAPNGYHVMFENAEKPLDNDSTVFVNFHFSDGEKIVARCAIKKTGK